MDWRPGHWELFCADTARARDFYERILGAQLLEEQEGGYVWLLLGAQELLLRPGNTARTDSYGQAGQALVLYTDDLPAARAALKKRGLEFRGEDGHPDCPTFQDPDGHWFQLVNPGELE